MNISVYRNSKKVMDKDIKPNRKVIEHGLMFLTISPGVYKIFFKLVSVYPFLIKELPGIVTMSAENALEYIGYLEYLITNGLL